MPKELRIKAVSDVAEVIKGLGDVTESLSGMGKQAVEAAGKSKAEWSELQQAIAKTNPELKGIADAAFGAGNALDKIGRAGEKFTAIDAALIPAIQNVKELEARLVAAEKAGIDMGEGPRASLAVMKAELQASIDKSEYLKKSWTEASAEAAKMGSTGVSAMKAVAVATAEIAPAAEKSSDALEKLSKAGTARELQQGINAAAFEVIKLEEKIQAARKVGGPVDPADIARIDQLRGALKGAAETAGKLGDETGDLKTQGNIAAQGMESLAGKVGSLDGMFGLAKDSGSKLLGSLGTLGFAVTGVKGAFDALKGAMEAIDKGMKAAGDAYVNYIGRTKDSENAAQKEAIATKAAAGGKIELGKSLTETVQNWDSYVAGTLRATKATDDFATATKNVKVPKAFSEIKQEALDMNTALALAFQEGKDKFRDYALANADDAKKLAEALKARGEVVPEYIQKALKAEEEYAKGLKLTADATEAAKNAGENRLKAMVDVYNKQQEAVKQAEEIIAAYNKEVEANGTSADSLRRKEAALDTLARSQGLTRAGLEELIKKEREAATAIAEGTSAAAAQEAALKANVSQIDADTEALRRNIAAQDEWIESGKRQRQTTTDSENAFRAKGEAVEGVVDQLNGYIGVAEGGSVIEIKARMAMEGELEVLDKLIAGWDRYHQMRAKVMEQSGTFADDMKQTLAILVASHESGTTSTVAFINELHRLMTQLSTTFPGATGKAKDAIDSLQETILKLIATSGGQQNTDVGYSGWLNQQFNDGDGI